MLALYIRDCAEQRSLTPSGRVTVMINFKPFDT